MLAQVVNLGSDWRGKGGVPWEQRQQFVWSVMH